MLLYKYLNLFVALFRINQLCFLFCFYFISIIPILFQSFQFYFNHYNLFQSFQFISILFSILFQFCFPFCFQFFYFVFILFHFVSILFSLCFPFCFLFYFIFSFIFSFILFLIMRIDLAGFLIISCK